MTKDISDSLVVNEWKSLFTNDIAWLSSKGEAPAPFEFDAYRSEFKGKKIHYDQFTIDRCDASGNLDYVAYHFHMVVKEIKSNETVGDKLFSAVAILKRDSAGKWKIALLAYKD